MTHSLAAKETPVAACPVAICKLLTGLPLVYDQDGKRSAGEADRHTVSGRGATDPIEANGVSVGNGSTGMPLVIGSMVAGSQPAATQVPTLVQPTPLS